MSARVGEALATGHAENGHEAKPGQGRPVYVRRKGENGMQSIVKQLGAVVVAALLAAGVVCPSAASAVEGTRRAAVEAIQQFRAGGHVAGFGPGAFYMSNATYALRVEFVGAHPATPQSEIAAETPAKGAPPLGRVTYANLWDGITLTYDAVEGGLARSTYRLEPGADPSAIRLRYNVPVTLNHDGTLTLAYRTGQMTESAPLAWQDVDGRRVAVAVSFALREGSDSETGQLVGFAVGDHDPSGALVIDPTLTWNTFLGGSGMDGAAAIAYSAGYLYVTGESDGVWGIPVRNYGGGSRDAFVAKLDATDGSLVWHTFLGGSGFDIGLAIHQNSGVCVVAGYSDATWGTPVSAYSGSFDAFVAKLDGTSGALIWNTFLGGGGSDFGYGIDGSGPVYVTGESEGWGTPVRAYSGGRDAFVAKLSASGSPVWHTFLGGSGSDTGRGIRSTSGILFVAGSSDTTWGGPLRAYSGGQDAFVARLGEVNGALGWNTFLGGTGDDWASAIAVESFDEYVVGWSTATWGTPLRAHGGSDDAFAARLDASGGLTWNTFLGGPWSDRGSAVVVDSYSSAVYVAGYGSSDWGPPVRAHSGGSEVFVAKLDKSSGVFERNTFVGGSGNDYGTFGVLAHDGYPGNLYVAGASEAAWGTPERSYQGGGDAFVAKLDLWTGYCPVTPASGCQTSGKGQILLTDNTDDSKDKFLWKFTKGPALSQISFGTSTTMMRAGLCVFDDGDLALEAHVGPSDTLWAAAGNRGWNYKDKTGTQDGTTIVTMMEGDAGKSRLLFKGKGANVRLPAPQSVTQFLAATTSVRAQLHGNYDTCYDTSFTPAQVMKNNGTRFKAKF